MTTGQEDDLVLDGNAVAGALSEIYDCRRSTGTT